MVVQFQVVAVSSWGLSRERGGHWPLLPAWFEVKWARLEGKKAVNRAKEVNKAGTRGARSLINLQVARQPLRRNFRFIRGSWSYVI